MASREEIFKKYGMNANGQVIQPSGRVAVNGLPSRDNETKEDIFKRYGMDASGAVVEKRQSTPAWNIPQATKEPADNKASGKFNGWKYFGNLGRTFVNGLASLAATGAWAEDQVTAVVDTIFQGAGTQGSGLFNALYHGRPDWKVFGENGLVGIKQEQEYLAQQRAEEIEKIATGNEDVDEVLRGVASFGGDTAQALGGATPMAVEALLTGGAGMADDLFKAGSNIIGKSGILESVSKPFRDMLTSRNYWTAFATEVGQDYQEALAEGATQAEASNYAVATALLNSAIEIGGGIQNVPKGFSAKQLLRSAAEEGLEEVEQGPVGRLMKNALLGKNAPLFSLTDEDAVVNPATAAKEFAGGFAVGGILGGGQAAFVKGANAVAERQIAKREKALAEYKAILEAQELPQGEMSGESAQEQVLENQKAIDRAQREAAMAEQERRNAPPTAKVEGKLTLPDGRKISTYTSDEKGNAFWVTDNGTVKGEEQDSSVVGAANKWGGNIGRVIVEQYDGADEATYAAAADVFVELGIQSVDGEMTWDKAAEITDAFVDEVGLEHANALYSAGVSAARSPAFRQYYHAGLIGNEMGSVSVQGKAWLSEAVRQYAYELGQAHAKDEKRHKYTVSKKAGFDSNGEGAKKLNRETRRVLDRIGKALGVEIRFATAEDQLSDDANGLYDAATGTIIISPNATNPVMVVVAHEVTHRLQDMDFEAYKQYRRFVIGKMEQRTGTMPVTKLRDRYRAFYGSNSFTDLQAMDELAADYTLAMIEDGNLFRELKEDNRSTARKMWSALKNFISRLTGSRPKGYSLYGTTIEELREAEKLWRGMLDGKKQAEEGNVWDAVVGGRYSLKNGENRLENTRQQAYTETKNFEEGVENGRERKETRESFLRRAAGAGYAVYEGTAYAYGFRPVQRQSAQRNARQVQEELRALGIDAEIIDGPILWNRKGVTVPVIVEQAATVEGRIFISDTATIASRNVAGHEAFHLWKNGANRDVYIETVEDNLLFASKSFREYQSTIAKAYLGGEADFTNAAQMAKLREELFAYISGDIHEGVHDVNLRPMFRDLDAVKAAWNELVEANKGGVRHSLKDRDYLAAVERGDMDTAQKMVDEAAKAAGYNEEVFHGMGHRHNVYESGNGQYGPGVYFTYDENTGKGYGNVVDHLYVKVGNIADYDDAYKALGKRGDQSLDDFAQALGFPSFDEMVDDWDNDPTDVASNSELIDILKNKGFDGFIDDGNAGFVLWDFDGIEYRIKLADPVTYDDNGNVIPLSERFNEKNPDIRYSLKVDSDGKALTEEQVAYFANSKSVDAQGRLRVMYRGGNSNFTVFDRKKSSYSNLYGRGFYFTDSKSHAEQYGNARAFYLNITNPVPTDERTITKEQLLAFLQAVAENEDDYSFENYGYGATPESVVGAIFSGKSDFAMLYDVSQTAIGDMVEAVELFNEINGTDFDGLILDTETVTFRSEQAKLTSNETPTDDPDIRFSLKSPVEQTARLIALHNLTEEKLLGDLKLGGLPMPSIAVVLAEAGHAKYGDISLVFGKDTIDPQFMRRNKVYGGDAWTPTFPRVEYDVDDDVVRKARNTIYAAADKTVLDSFGYMGLDSDNMEDGLNRNDGDVAAIYRYKDGMKYAYLAATQQYTPPMKAESLGKYSGHENEVILAVYDALGGDLLDELRNGGYQRYQSDKEMVSRVADIINGAYVKMLGRDDFDMFANLSFSDFNKIIIDAARYADYGNETIGQEVDISAARKEINELVDQEAYEQWVRQLFDGIIKKSGIRNEKNPFTPSGNRRSFDALHYEVTLENIVKAMQNATQKGGGAFFGGGEIWGVATKDYKSIDDIRADSGRLGMLSDDEYHDIREGFSDRLAEICTEIADPRGGNRFIAIDNAAAAIVETLRTKKTAAAIDKELRSYSYLNVKSDTAEKALALFRDIQNMPTGYFEAKPQRAVGFDEVLAAVVPDNTSEALLSKLAERGINVLTYKQGDDADRLRAVNSVEDAKFSLKSDAAMGNTLRDMAEAEDATKQAVKAWIRDVHRGKKVSVSYDEAERVARNLINDYRSTADSMNVTGAVLDLFNYLQNGDGNKNMDEATVQEKANAVAAALLSEELRGSYYTADYVETGNGMELSDLAQDNEELRAFLRGTKIVYPKQYVSDLGTETWTEFTAGLKGARARLSDENNRANVDTLYRDDLSRMWPQYFPDSITGEAAMMQRIAEVSRKVFEREAIKRDNANGEVMTRLTAADVLDRFFNLPQVGKTYVSVRNLREKSTRAVRNLQNRLQVRDTQGSRASIIRKVKALDKKLRDNTEKSHVPDYLRSAVLELCSMFTQNTSVFTKSQLAVIKLQYDALAKDENMQMVYDDEISAMLEELAQTLDGRRLSELKGDELQWVNDIVSHFSHLVNNANQAFLDDKRVAVADMANKVISKAVTDKKRANLPIPKLIGEGNIKPYYFFKDIGGQMEALFADLLNGQARYGLLMNAAQEFCKSVYAKYNADKWLNSDKKLEMNTEHGDSLVLSVNEALSILATYKREVTNREQDAGHLTRGGIVYEDEMQREIDNNKKLSVKALINKVLQKPDVKAKPISMGDVLEISQWLRQNVSPNAEAFVDEMVGYLSNEMAELGNETSMKLSGIRKYMERFYFPYKVSSVYLATKLRDPKESPALRRPGFSKRTMHKANNPIVLRGFTDVWSEHVSEMLTYATMAIPQDTLLRVLNYNDTLVDVEDDTNIYKNVKEAIQNTYGKNAVEYIEQLLRDMNGGVAIDEREKFVGKLVRIYKKNAVGLSLSVAIQQPTSAVRAMAEIDPKYFFSASLNGDYEQLKKYAGVAVIKEMGGFDTNLGRGGASWLKGDESFIEKAIGILPQKMDQGTWAYLWNVVKAETRDKHPELLDNGNDTEAFLEAAGKRFGEVVEKTQVYDSVLSRSENMRSKSGLANLFLSFMSEPMVTLNMAVDAIRSGDKKRMGRVAGTLLVSIVFNNIVKALWTAGRDDEEEKTYLEKLTYRFNDYMSSDLMPWNYIPIIKDIDDIVKGYTSSIELYEPLEDVVKKYQKASEMVQDFGVSGVCSEETMDLLLALPSLAGVPLDNAKRDVETLINLFTKMAPVDSVTKRDILNAFREGWGANSTVTDYLREGWEASRKGNTDKRKKALAEIEAIYQDKVRSYQKKGKTLEEAKKSAKSSIQTSCTNYLKPLYQAANGLEKNEIKSMALRIGVGGKQLYADYDFSKWDE